MAHVTSLALTLLDPERKARAEQFAQNLLSHSRFVVISHYNPDADAFGSSCALSLLLERLGKEVVCVNETGALSRYMFIPRVDSIVRKMPDDHHGGMTPDAIVVCDCGSLHRVGESLFEKVNAIAPMLNIDHHSSNDLFGTHTYVCPEASSTSELVFDVIVALKDETLLTPEIATALYAGIVGDTGSFRYQSTSAHTFEVATRLVNAGASPSMVASALFSSNTIASVKLQSAALTDLTLHADGKVAEVVVTTDMLHKYNATQDDTDPLVERARDIEGVEISALIRQDHDIWRVSLRSRTPRYDVSTIASHFGGGGHKCAAAFRWRRSFEELHPLLLKELLALAEG